MPTYIALLRAINLGSKRRFPKADIIAATESVGATDVETYINTGNVRLTVPLRSTAKVEQALEQAYLDDRGFEVASIVLTPRELSAIAKDAEEFGADLLAHSVQYVSVMKAKPAAALARALESNIPDGQHVRVHGRAVHLALEHGGTRSAPVSNATIERRLGVATSRNVTVIRELAKRWGAGA